MKHLKTFEIRYTDKDDKLNLIYKKGDYVVLLYGYDAELEEGFNVDDVYKIINIDKNDYEFPYEISWLTDKNSIWVKEDQLRLAYDYEIQANKYNL